MNTFEKILEIKTAKKEFVIKAVYVPNSTSDWKGSYFIYYYDIFTHSFFINDIDRLCNNTRTKAINIIENIVNKAYKQEMNSFIDIVKKIQMAKKPNVFCIYEQALTKEILMDRISFKYLKDKHWHIIKVKNPRWDRKELENTLKMLGLKKSIEL